MTVGKKLMHKTWLAGSLLAAALLASCNKDNTDNNALLSYIPADTPVVMSVEINDRVLPRALVEKYDQAFDAAVRFQRERFKLALGPMLRQAGDPERKAALKKVMAFIDRWVSAEKLRQTGFDPRDLAMALYTVDLVPVLRVRVVSETETEQFMDELVALVSEIRTDLKTQGLPVVEKTESDGQTSYTAKFGDNRLLIHLDSNQLVAAFAPASVLDKHTEVIRGLKKPDQPLAGSSRLETFFSRYGYQPGQVFWIDWRQLAGYFFDPDNHPSDMLGHYRDGQDNASSACNKEVLEMVGVFPRMVGGIKSAGEHVLVSQLLWEMDAGVAQKLVTVSNEIPAFLPGAQFGFGFSIDLPALKKRITEWALSVQNAPYRCDKLKGLNALASAIQAKAARSTPFFAGDFKGFSLSFQDMQLDTGGFDQSGAPGWQDVFRLMGIQLATGITFENPAGLIGMIQLASAGLFRLQVSPDGKAVDLSQASGWQAINLPDGLKPVWMAMKDNRLMLTFGIDNPSVVEKLVSAPGDRKALKGVLRADYYRWLGGLLQSAFAHRTDSPAGDRSNDELALWADYLKAGLWWQRQEIGVNFGDKGLEVNMETDF